MPIYEYYCGKCDKTYELLQSVSAPKMIECGGAADKIMSSFSARIKKSPEEIEASKYDWKDGKVVQNKKWHDEFNRQMAGLTNETDTSKDEK